MVNKFYTIILGLCGIGIGLLGQQSIRLNLIEPKQASFVWGFIFYTFGATALISGLFGLGAPRVKIHTNKTKNPKVKSGRELT